ncbi:hypothetical protein MRGA423_09515 [Mycobacterium tuberculosis RGTB423]|nr:hypothetical protein MRGA423_09515 [Mycobacterium tuberculosis RGTB423]
MIAGVASVDASSATDDLHREVGLLVEKAVEGLTGRSPPGCEWSRRCSPWGKAGDSPSALFLRGRKGIAMANVNRLCPPAVGRRGLVVGGRTAHAGEV